MNLADLICRYECNHPSRFDNNVLSSFFWCPKKGATPNSPLYRDITICCAQCKICAKSCFISSELSDKIIENCPRRKIVYKRDYLGANWREKHIRALASLAPFPEHSDSE